MTTPTRKITVFPACASSSEWEATVSAEPRPFNLRGCGRIISTSRVVSTEPRTVKHKKAPHRDQPGGAVLQDNNWSVTLD